MSFFKFISSKVFLKQIGLAVVAIIVLVIIITQWLRITTNHGEFIVVPDLTHKSLREAKTIVDNADLRIEVTDSADYDPDTMRFAILTQEPKPGSKVKQDRKIMVKINPSGYRKITIPQLKQLTRRNAEAMLKAVGLKPGKTIYVDDIGKDIVLNAMFKRDTLRSGDQLPKTSVVDLICGNGVNPDDPKFDMPEVPIDSLDNQINGSGE